jgi:hypothetical protein
LATYCAPARTLLESLELVSNSWHRTDLLDGLVGVWLPPGASLDSSRAGDGAGGYHWWSPDIEAGGFAVFHGPGDGRGPETLLEGARARGDVKIEADTLDDRGDMPVRRIVYRLQGFVPHVLIATPEGQRHHGGEALVELGDHLFFDAGGEHVRAGYQVREDAPAEVRETFAEVLARVEVGEP